MPPTLPSEWLVGVLRGVLAYLVTLAGYMTTLTQKESIITLPLSGLATSLLEYGKRVFFSQCVTRPAFSPRALLPRLVPVHPPEIMERRKNLNTSERGQLASWLTHTPLRRTFPITNTIFGCYSVMPSQLPHQATCSRLSYSAKDFLAGCTR